jgi:tetratricopeptide (TPR) repeat protein
MVLLSLLAWAAFALGEDGPKSKLDRDFQAAVAAYEAGRPAEAAAQLEKLMPQVPNSFEAHELLGMVYSSLGQGPKAVEQLKTAVRLKPDSAPARTNLAASLSRAGDLQAAGVQFRKALELEPGDYSANHNLAEFYVQAGRIEDALPLLKKAQEVKPDAYDNGYDLVLAEFSLGRLSEARTTAQRLLQVKDTGELHDLLGQIEEKDGKYVAAANEYEKAVRLEPSEDNLFDWGSELLLHRTVEPAIEVFREAARRYPASARLQIGLGMALYSRGLYEESIQALLAAADLSPSDPRCYLFLSRAYDSSPKQAGEVIERFRRYAELQPGNALAQYYYAMSLWKGKRVEDASLDLPAVEALLRKAISLDGSLAEAHLQLGNLYADQHEYAKSIPEYTRALELNPKLPDAHYRLGTDYVHTGQKEKAQGEFATYQKLRAEHLAEVDKERAEVQQFVIAEKTGHGAKQ